MAKILLILKLLLILIFAGWVSLWVLRPTEIWTKKWKQAEEIASSSVFDYNDPRRSSSRYVQTRGMCS
ncbi:hypothetical protein OROGR_004485 [Orobanche gracilis]